MRDRRPVAIWTAIAVATVILVALVFPHVFWGIPRNQHIDSVFIERHVKLGMTPSQVAAVLGIPAREMRACSWRGANGETEVEVVGSYPPWCELRPGNRSLVIRFNGCGRVTGGYGTWYGSDEDDGDLLQLEH